MTYTNLNDEFLQHVEDILERGDHIGIENKISRTRLRVMICARYPGTNDRKVREAVSLIGAIYTLADGGGYALPRDMEDAKTCLYDLNSKKRAIISRMDRIVDRAYERSKRPVQVPEDAKQLQLI